MFLLRITQIKTTEQKSYCLFVNKMEKLTNHLCFSNQFQHIFEL